MGRLVILILSAGLIGCVTPTMWSKPGLSSLEIDRDEAECRQSAWREVDIQRHMNYGLFPTGRITPYRGPAYVYGYGAGPWGGGRDPFLESRLNDFCMSAKGYQRVTVESR